MKTTDLTPTKTLSVTFKQSLVVLSTSLLLCSTMMSAQAVTVYKFVRDGIVTYSQLPPTDVTEVEVIELLDDGRRSNAGDLAGKTGNETEQTEELTEEQQRIAQLEKEMERQRAQDLAEQCQRRRYDLTNLNSGGRVYELDENGQKKFLDNRQIEQKRETLQQAINQYCN